MLTMHSKTSALIAGLVLMLGLTVAVAAVPVKEFEGSRGDVRVFCDSDESVLLEGGSYSLCVTRDSDVVCHDDGVCSSSDLTLAMAAGFRDALVADAGAIQK